MNEASFADIPEELQINILSRLPPKPLSRCKCVSKHWNTTLTVQAFLLRLSLSYDKHSKLAFVAHWTIKGDDSILSFELSDNTTSNRKTMTVPKTTKMSVRNSRTMEIREAEVIIAHHLRFTEPLIGSYNKSNICNDLICLFNQFSTRVGLLNLKTQDFIHLPAVTTESAGCNRFWYALGFDPVSNVYKLLSIYGGSKACHTKASIFSPGSNHWKPIEYKFLGSAVIMNWCYWRSNDSLCLDGVIYWVNEFHGASMLTVVAFDLKREVFTNYKLDTIPIKEVETIKYYLTSLKGNPTLFIWQKNSDEIQQLTLFNHKNPKGVWNRKSFIAHDFPKEFPYGCRWTRVAGGNILLRHAEEPIRNLLKPEEQDNPLLSRNCPICSKFARFICEVVPFLFLQGLDFEVTVVNREITCIVDNFMEMNIHQKVTGGVKRRKCDMSNASNTDIPDEIQIDILSRLPSETLSRCKCVCKHWNTTLLIQVFMLRHSLSYDEHSELIFVRNRPIKGLELILSFELISDMSVPKTITKMTAGRNIHGCPILGHREPFMDALLSKCKYNDMSNICNDLVCLFDSYSTRVTLVNLKTKDFIRLPQVTTHIVGSIRYWYALGFDPVNKVYKVLCIYGRKKMCHRTKAALFTLGSKHWKPIEYKCLHSWISHNRFCLDGVIYWLNDNKIHGRRELTVVAFDLNREMFRDYNLDTSPIKDAKKIRYYLTSLKRNPTLFIWEMESDEIEQFTLFNHKNPKVTWNTRIFTAHDFPKSFPYGHLRTCVAGGTILLKHLTRNKSPLEQYKSPFCWFKWYDLENFAID